MQNFAAAEGLEYALLTDDMQLDGEEPASFSEHLTALGAFLLCLVLVLASIAAGWALLWHAALRKIGMFKDMMGPKKVPDPAIKRQAELDIQRIKQQLSRASPAASSLPGEAAPISNLSAGAGNMSRGDHGKGD